MMKQRHSVIISTALAFVLPVPAQALPASNAATPSAVVTHRDLDLTNAAGVAALHGRVRRAVSDLCANDGARDLKSKSAARNCIAATLADVANAEQRAVARAEAQATRMREALALAQR